MAVYDINGNEIGGGGGGTNQKILCFDRVYDYINPQLLCERKELNNDGTLSTSTTKCVIHLPKNGLVEVRMQIATVMFKVAKVSGSTVTWLDPEWSYYSTRYIGDNTSDYYAVVAKAPTGTSAITTEEAITNMAVYQFVDIGTKRNITSLLNGKTVAFIGDSITQGRFRKFASSGGLTWTATKPFGGIIAEIANDMNYGNFGIGGALVAAGGDTWKSLVTNCGKVSGYNVVFICGGTNDYGGNVSQATFTSAYQTVVDTLKANNTEVVACTPVYRTSKTGANTQGLTLQNYCTIIKNVAAAKRIKCIDLYPLTNDGVFITFCPDGLHPNEVGHKIIADLIVDEYEKLSN